MKKGNRILLGITAAIAALGIGIVVGGTLVSVPTTSDAPETTETKVVVPEIPAKALASKRIMLVATPAANRDVVNKVQKNISRAAGVISGVITLTPKFSDPASDLELGTLITETLPAGITLPTDRDQNSGRLAGVVLSGLAEKPSNPKGDTVRSEFLDRMVRAGFFAKDSYFGAADAAILITGSDSQGKVPPSETGRKGTTLAKLGKGLAESGTPTVVAGPGQCLSYPSPALSARDMKIKKLRAVEFVDNEAGQAQAVVTLSQIL
ncbi:MAG: copper transporter [Lawsonella sp.]